MGQTTYQGMLMECASGVDVWQYLCPERRDRCENLRVTSPRDLASSRERVFVPINSGFLCDKRQL